MALHVGSFLSLSLQWKFEDVKDSTSDGEVFRVVGFHFKASTGLELCDK